MFTAAAVAVCVGLLSVASANDGDRPTRSECILGYKLDWASVRENPDDVRNAMDWPTGVQAIEPLAAMRFSLDGSYLYLQFKSDCANKRAMGTSLIGYWRRTGLDLPLFVVVPDPIIPSPSTIDVTGHHWRDGSPREPDTTSAPGRRI